MNNKLPYSKFNPGLTNHISNTTYSSFLNFTKSKEELKAIGGPKLFFTKNDLGIYMKALSTNQFF